MYIIHIYKQAFAVQHAKSCQAPAHASPSVYVHINVYRYVCTHTYTHIYTQGFAVQHAESCQVQALSSPSAPVATTALEREEGIERDTATHNNHEDSPSTVAAVANDDDQNGAKHSAKYTPVGADKLALETGSFFKGLQNAICRGGSTKVVVCCCCRESCWYFGG